MADKLVSVNDDFDFPAPVAARQAARLGDATTAEGKAVTHSITEKASIRPPRAFISGNTRRLAVPITDCSNTAAAAARSFTQRTIVNFPQRVKRLRIRVANRNLAEGVTLTSPATITSLYIGTPEYGTTGSYRWNGNFTTTPTPVFTDPLPIPTNGADAISPWLEVPEDIASQEILLSWGVTTEASGNGIGIGACVQAIRVNGGLGAGYASEQAIAGLAPAFEEGKIFADFRVEYEFEGPARIGLFVGDSISAGYTGTDRPPESEAKQAGVLPGERWPDQAGLMGGFGVVNLAFSTAKGGQFADPASMHFDRAAIGSSVIPDFAVVAIGTNDLLTGFTAVTSGIAGAVASCRALGIKNIYVATILPRRLSALTGKLTTAAAVGATTVTTDFDTGTNQIVVGGGSNYDVSVVKTKTGSNPYTLTIEPALTKAHPAGTEMASSLEAARVRANAWIRQLPCGISGVLDFDDAMAVSSGSPLLPTRYAIADGLHLNRPGMARLSQYAASILSAF